MALPKGSTVVLRVPTQFWRIEGLERSDLKIELPFKSEKGTAGDLSSFFVDVSDVLGQKDWATSGFPFCGDLMLTRIFELKSFAMHHELPYTEVELRSSTAYVRLHFAHVSSDAGALNAEFQKLVAAGTWGQFKTTDDFHNNVFRVQQARIFTGPMAALSDRTKGSLMEMACTGQNTFGAETYKSKNFFAITLGSDSQIYNSNVMNSSARVAKVINERIVERVKAFKAPAQETGLDGLKFAADISFRNFVNEAELHNDRLEIYFPLDLCLKFTDADITSQQLIDGSIVLLNGNRIQVPLSAGG